MVADATRIVSVWAVLIVPFVLLTAYLWTTDDLGVEFVAAYWFAPVVLTLIGVLPSPWRLLAV